MDLVRIISDGGGDGRNGAGAAVVYLPVSWLPAGTSDRAEADSAAPSPSPVRDNRFKLVGLLGGVDSTDAELGAGILGLLFVNRCAALRGTSPFQLEWVSDNHHLIQFGRALPALDPKRQEPLWKLASRLSTNAEVRTIHVSSFPRTHAATRAHHSCDRASTWIQRKGERLLEEHGPGAVGLHQHDSPARCWQLCDLRPLIDLATADPSRSETIEPALQAVGAQFDYLLD